MDAATKKYLDTHFSSLQREITEVKGELVGITGKLETLEDTIDAKLSELGDSIQPLATHMDERFDESAPAIARIDNHEKRIKYLEDKLPKLA